MNTNDEEITVRVQQMFPNCGKYRKCCADSGYEETMKKFKKMKDKPIERIRKKAEKDHRITIVKRVKPVKKNPFSDKDILGKID